MKEYRITYTGGACDTAYITADNKTMARMSFKGEHNPWCKIVKIEEVKGNE